MVEIAEETGVNQLARGDKEQGQAQPMSKIIGFPGALSQVADSCHTKKEAGPEFRRPMNQEVRIVSGGQTYESKTEKTNSHPDPRQQIDNNFRLSVCFQPQLVSLPSQQACSHHKREEHPRSDTAPRDQGGKSGGNTARKKRGRKEGMEAIEQTGPQVSAAEKQKGAAFLCVKPHQGHRACDKTHLRGNGLDHGVQLGDAVPSGAMKRQIREKQNGRAKR